MEDDVMDFMVGNSNYLESLCKSRKHLIDSPLLAKLDEVIELEIQLALMGAEKAQNEILKETAKVTPLKLTESNDDRI